MSSPCCWFFPWAHPSPALELRQDCAAFPVDRWRAGGEGPGHCCNLPWGLTACQERVSCGAAPNFKSPQGRISAAVPCARMAVAFKAPGRDCWEPHRIRAKRRTYQYTSSWLPIATRRAVFSSTIANSFPGESSARGFRRGRLPIQTLFGPEPDLPMPLYKRYVFLPVCPR